MAVRGAAAGLAPGTAADSRTRRSILPQLTGSRCQCAACGALFNSITVFDKHRRGDFSDQGRQRNCIEREEMLLKGWSRNGSGFWIESRMSSVDRERTRRSGDRRSVGGQVGGPS
jgi:hypothetical protein